MAVWKGGRETQSKSCSFVFIFILYISYILFSRVFGVKKQFNLYNIYIRNMKEAPANPHKYMQPTTSFGRE
jgi:hypothetical protein